MVFAGQLGAGARVDFGHDVVSVRAFIPGAVVALLVMVFEPGGPVIIVVALDDFGAHQHRMAPPPQLGLWVLLQNLQRIGQAFSAAIPLQALVAQLVERRRVLGRIGVFGDQRGAVQQQPLALALRDDVVNRLPLLFDRFGPVGGQRLHLGFEPLPAGLDLIHGRRQRDQAFLVLISAAGHPLGRVLGIAQQHAEQQRHTLKPLGPAFAGAAGLGGPVGGGAGVFVVGQEQGVVGHGRSLRV